MVDRYHPGASLLSFLNESNINYVNRGVIDVPLAQNNKPIVEVKTTADTVKDMIVDAKATSDINVEIANAAEETKSINEAKKGDNVLPGVSTTAEEASVVEEAFDQRPCPCLQKLAARHSTETASLADDVAKTVESFCSQETFVKESLQTKGILGRRIQRAANDAKTKLRALNKPFHKRSSVERFCDEHWHSLTTTFLKVFTAIVVILFFMSMFKIIKLTFGIERGPRYDSFFGKKNSFGNGSGFGSSNRFNNGRDISTDYIGDQ